MDRGRAGVLRRDGNPAGPLYAADRFHSLRRDGGRLLPVPPARRRMADPEPWRGGRPALLHLPPPGRPRRRPVEPRRPDPEKEKQVRPPDVMLGGGGPAMLKTIMECRDRRSGVTPRDGLIGAGVMLAVSFICSGLGIVLRRSGWLVTGEILKGLAFPASFTLSMPWWLMKGSPWKAQVVIVGGTLLVLLVLTWLS